jgi:hypothetical protein
MEFWNWSLWVLVPVGVVLAALVAYGIRLSRTDPKLVAQRERYRQEGLGKGFYPHPVVFNFMLYITIACWVIADIAFSRGNVTVGVLLVIVPLALLVWETKLERRHHRERTRT